MTSPADIDFFALYRDYKGFVQNRLRALGGDEELVQDLTQEVFLAVHRYGNSFDPAKGSPASWIGTIARNTFFRHAGRKNALQNSGELPEDIPDPAEDATQATDLEERNHIIREAVLRLPEMERRVISLKFFDRLGLREASEKLGISQSTLGRRLADAYKLLRAELKKEGITF